MSKRRRTLAVVGTALAVAGGFGASRYVSGGADEAEAIGEQEAIVLIDKGVAHLEATTITYDQWLRRNYPEGVRETTQWFLAFAAFEEAQAALMEEPPPTTTTTTEPPTTSEPPPTTTEPEPADTVPPLVPTNQQIVDITQTSARMTWDAATDNVGVTNYNVFLDNVRVAQPVGLAWTLGNLACGTTYLAGLTAQDAAGNVSDVSLASGPFTTSDCDEPPPTTTEPPPTTTEPEPPPSGSANLWVDANGGTCVRSATPVAYSDGQACGSMDAAYDKANASPDASLVLIRGGTYPGQTITGNRASGGTITFDVDGPVTLNGILAIGACRDCGTTSPDRLTIRRVRTGLIQGGWENAGYNRYGINIRPGSTFVRLENVSGGGVSMDGASDIQVIGGDQGPCRAQSEADWLAHGIQPCASNRIDAHPDYPMQRVLIDGVDFHDNDYSASCIQQASCHWRSFYINGVHGLTLRNSTFRDGVFQPWLTRSGTGTTWNYRDILIENNQFGTPVATGAGQGQKGTYAHGYGFLLAHCEGGAADQYVNVTIRFNSFSRRASFEGPAPGPGCNFSNVRVYGNVMSKTNCTAGVAYSHNVYNGPAVGTCGGAGEVNIGGGAFPFYSTDTDAPLPGSFALAGALAAPDDRVPVSLGCPATDALGRERGVNGFCDAGAHERD